MKKKILFVAMQMSIHTARWINQISTKDYEIHLFAVNNALPHQLVNANVVIHYPIGSLGCLRILINRFKCFVMSLLGKGQSNQPKIRFIYSLELFCNLLKQPLYMHKSISKVYDRIISMKSLVLFLICYILLSKLSPTFIHFIDHKLLSIVSYVGYLTSSIVFIILIFLFYKLKNTKLNGLHQFGNSGSFIPSLYGPKTLYSLIKNIQPNLIHSLEFQTCGYNVLEAKFLSKYNNQPFPKWWATNWGSDIYFFQKDEEHKKIIKTLLSNIDYYSCECYRDIELAKNLGYKGEVLSIIPNTGGMDIQLAQSLRNKYLPSTRKLIMVKGYQSFAGRALTTLQSIEKCYTFLKDYEIIVYSVHTNDVRDKIYLIRNKLGLDIKELPYTTDYKQMLELFSKARIYIGVSISDGISTSLLESMTMGAFPIQTNTSSCNEWIKDGISGFVIPPDDVEIIALRIQQALQDDKLVDQALEINWQVVLDRLDSEKLKVTVSNMYNTVLS